MRATKLIQGLIDNNYHISVAESCTGGMLASSIVSVSNASKVFNESYVTYSNEAKINILGVNPKIIEDNGAVSEATVLEMVKGLYEKTKAEITIAISGIAGPNGGTIAKPVGMVCFGFGLNGTFNCTTKYFGKKSRQKIREKAVNYAINEAIDLLFCKMK